MQRLRFAPALLGLLVLHSAAALAGAQGRWELLGERTVTDRLDHDVIVVTAARGDFTAIKLGVRRAGVDFHRVVVHYANGGDQELELRATIPAGGETRVIDLRGGERVIRSVEFWYDARTIRGRRAVVRVWARS